MGSSIEYKIFHVDALSVPPSMILGDPKGGKPPNLKVEATADLCAQANQIRDSGGVALAEVIHEASPKRITVVRVFRLGSV